MTSIMKGGPSYVKIGKEDYENNTLCVLKLEEFSGQFRETIRKARTSLTVYALGSVRYQKTQYWVVTVKAMEPHDTLSKNGFEYFLFSAALQVGEPNLFWKRYTAEEWQGHTPYLYMFYTKFTVGIAWKVATKEVIWLLLCKLFALKMRG